MTKSSPPRIPPLPLHVLKKVQEIERHLRLSLESASHSRGMDQINTEQVRRVLDTCVVEALDLQLEYYASVAGYCPEWIALLAASAVDSALGLFPLFTSSEPFRPNLQQTVRDYLARRRAKTVPALQPGTSSSEPLNRQIEAFRVECRITVEELAEGLDVAPRSVYRHLSGEAAPRHRQIASYEKLFSQKLGRKIRLETSSKRQ